MSSLYVYHLSSPEQPYKVLSHAEDIASTLSEHGVGFDRWHIANPVRPGTDQDDVLSLCQARIDALMTERGVAVLDVISVDEAHPQKAELRAAYLDEHQYASDQLYVFAAGKGLLTLRFGDYVYALLCERNDQISIPAGARRWFDMGENPRLVAIRLFKHPSDGKVHFSSDSISTLFPALDDL